MEFSPPFSEEKLRSSDPGQVREAFRSAWMGGLLFRKISHHTCQIRSMYNLFSNHSKAVPLPISKKNIGVQAVSTNRVAKSLTGQNSTSLDHSKSYEQAGVIMHYYKGTPSKFPFALFKWIPSKWGTQPLQLQDRWKGLKSQQSHPIRAFPCFLTVPRRWLAWQQVVLLLQRSDTLPRFNMEPKNDDVQEESPIPACYFQVPC